MSSRKTKQHDLVTRIKNKAKELGFCAVGVAPAQLEEEFVQRLAQQDQPPFVRWQPEQRCRAGLWHANARSVIAVAFCYAHRYPSSSSAEHGYISPSAGEPDYHKLMHQKLDQLGRYLVELQPGTAYTSQVDSGPGCERLFALRAGVGWQGKNNFIIVPGHGSFVWLGLISTNLELPPDQPLPSQCGSCQRCLQACPTQAYAQPNSFDHAQCMAYWASDKNKLSAGQCRMLGKYKIIYGCDFCQLACPHNSVQGQGNLGPSLEQIMHMSQTEFKELFRNTAAGWRGRKVLRRNAVLAARGNAELRQSLVQLAQGTGEVAQYAQAVLDDFCRWDE